MLFEHEMFWQRIMIMASPGSSFFTLPIKAVKARCSDPLLLLEVEILNPQISFHFMFWLPH
jgi:hypothetical protein